jgi:YVTN family beta-propeller protein
VGLSCVVALWLARPTTVRAQAPGYHLLRTYKIGGEGFWDYLTVDSEARRVYISRGTHVMVLDADNGKVVGDIPDTPGVHGIALISSLNRGFISNGRGNNVTAFDLLTLKVIGHVPTGENPDAIIYDPGSNRVFAFNGRGGSATAIDPVNLTVAATIPLGGKPEFAAADGAGHVFVNIEDKSELVRIDSENLKVLDHWPIKGCESPSGLSMDTKNHRLFSGCHNEVLAVIDAKNGFVMKTLPIGRGVDATAFDSETGLAFSSNGDGTLTVIHEDTPYEFKVVENVSTQRGARTMAVDEKTHHVFLVTAEFGPTPAATAENPRPRPAMLPDSFVVLEYGK